MYSSLLPYEKDVAKPDVEVQNSFIFISDDLVVSTVTKFVNLNIFRMLNEASS